MSETDRMLLQEYEPILCFSGATDEEDYTERFYPINVEAYLQQCTLWERQHGILRWFLRPREVTRKWDRAAKRLSTGDADFSPGEARAEALEKFNQQHFLRFIPQKEEKQEKKRRECLSQSVLIVDGFLAVFFLPLLAATIWASRAGITWLAWLAGIPTVLVFLFMANLYLLSRVSDEIAVAVPGLLFGLLLLGIAVWAWSAGVGWLAWLTGVLGTLLLLGELGVYFESSLSPGPADFMTLSISLLIAVVPPLLIAARLGWRWYLAVPALAWLLTGLLTILVFGGEQGLAAFLTLTSPSRDKASARAHALCQEFHERSEDEERSRHVYYGRVWPDAMASEVVLQYFFFYAFNDWRHHGGFNCHEGDWEATFVFLERKNGQLVPTGVGLPQHHEGDYRPWKDVEKWPDCEKGPHPVIYVAAGSHANYFASADRPMHSLFRPGFGQKAVAAFERIRDQFLPDAQRQQQLLIEAVERQRGPSQEADALRDETAHKLAERAARPRRKAEERPNGRGLVIGPGKPEKRTRQEHETWPDPVVLREDALPGWIAFRGLWGLKTLLKDESGPPGPRWERPGHQVEEKDREALKDCEGCRLYWAAPLHWLNKVKEKMERRLSS